MGYKVHLFDKLGGTIWHKRVFYKRTNKTYFPYLLVENQVSIILS